MKKNSKTKINFLETFLEHGEEQTCVQILNCYCESINIMFDSILKEKNFSQGDIQEAKADFFIMLFSDVEALVITQQEISDIIFEIALQYINENFLYEDITVDEDSYDHLPEKHKKILVDKNINNLSTLEISKKYNISIEEINKDIMVAEMLSEYLNIN